MGEVKFDTSLRDSQGTEVAPVAPENFDLDAYAEYEAAMLERTKDSPQGTGGFWFTAESARTVYFTINAGIIRNLWRCSLAL